jgi:hypothetical protein
MFSPDDVQLLPHVKDDQKFKVPIKHIEEFQQNALYYLVIQNDVRTKDNDQSLHVSQI